MNKVAVLGAGGWGTALAALLVGQGRSTTLWGRSPALVEELRIKRENTPYLPGVTLPKELDLTSDLAAAVDGAEAVVLVVPAQAMRQVVQDLAGLLRSRPLVVSCAKGLERSSHLRMTQVIGELLPRESHRGIVALSGPNHAEEVGRRIPSATVVASADERAAEEAQALFMTPQFRVYTNADVIGVELGGALKNIIALAAGVSDGLGFGDNTKAALMTRGMAEIARLGLALGANPLTFAGLAGMGDLIATCTSLHSRNRAAGERIGRGESLEQILAGSRMVIEGVWTTTAALELAEACGVELPIAAGVRDVLFRGKDPREAVGELMERNPRAEEASFR
ncbi:MAG TPA: NAD(P)H-dependent glycerol-3-phosphate dehydrogenase [Firmicutes bacterium]|nr:NAD(P)H-dependent glycerol-3-phosphate dehydrogenase [Bacillota bacterium]